jgi:hypothetical protein
MSETWIQAFTVKPWMNSNSWFDFFSKTEAILTAKLSSLDTNDPPKRNINKLNFESIGEFITNFGLNEDARWIFGRFKNANIDIMIHHHKNIRSSEGDLPNSISFFFPEGYCDTESGLRCVDLMFDLINNILKPFYSFADWRDAIVKKKKIQGAVNIQEELIGIFWLTFFNDKYMEFFGRDKLALIHGFSNTAGFKLKLAESPSTVTSKKREEIEMALGKESFVDPTNTQIKALGMTVLPFVRLL